MLSFKEFINENENRSVEQIIKEFGNTHNTYEYMSGDCYQFAAALYLFNNKQGKLIIASDKDVGEHAFYEYHNKFYDATGGYNSKDALINNAEMGFNKPLYKYVTFDTMTNTNNNNKLTLEILKDFIHIQA